MHRHLLSAPSLVGGAAFGIELKGSMSAYYHSPMRNAFVGLLFVVGSCQYLYEGFSRRQNFILNLASVFAVGVAIFPTDVSGLHVLCALLLFACLAYVSLFTHGDTVKYIVDEKRAARCRCTYKFLAFAMAACPAIAALLIGLLAWDTEHKGFVFALDLGGIWAFVAYWLVKSHEIKGTKEDAARAVAQAERSVPSPPIGASPRALPEAIHLAWRARTPALRASPENDATELASLSKRHAERSMDVADGSPFMEWPLQWSTRRIQWPE